MSPPSPARDDAPFEGLAYTNPEELIDAIAERVAAVVLEQLGDGASAQPPALLDVAEVARLLGVSPDYVRAHRDELGAVRLPGAVLRFDAAAVAERLSVRCSSERPDASDSPTPPDVSAARRRRRTGAAPDLLPIRGRQVPS